jgi:hypothetical protein
MAGNARCKPPLPPYHGDGRDNLSVPTIASRQRPECASPPTPFDLPPYHRSSITFSKSRNSLNRRPTSDWRYATEWDPSGDRYVSYVFSLTGKLIVFYPPVSPQSTQSSSSQDPWNPCETEKIFCYSNRRREDMADTIRAERGSTRGMERDRRHLVRIVAICFVLMYN